MTSQEHFGYLPKDKRTPEKQYHELLKEILTRGQKHSPIHGDNSLRIIGHIMRFKRENGLPAVTARDLTKWDLVRGAIGENIGFMNGASTLAELEQYGCPRKFWDKWVTAEKCAKFGLVPGDLGPGSYGNAWAKFPKPDGGTFNQIEALVRQMIKRPMIRTNVVTPWIPFYCAGGDKNNNPRKVVVAPCHGWVQPHIDTEAKSFVLTHEQRSADTPVGLQFNLIQYFCMGLMLERVTGLKFTELVYYIKDAHIYDMQLEYACGLVNREPRINPVIYFTDDAPTGNIFDFRPHHFILDEYDPHQWIQIPTPV